MPYSKGFTLIELVITITIIALLAVIGMTVYTGISKNATTSRRISDIQSIAQALEVHKDPATGNYTTPQGNWFAAGSIPKDPVFNTCSNGTQNNGCIQLGQSGNNWGYNICGVSTFNADPTQDTTCSNLPQSNFYVCGRLTDSTDSNANTADMWYGQSSSGANATFCVRNSQ